MIKAISGDSLTFFDGDWKDGSPAIIRPKDHGFWLASNVFDGARSLTSKVPDLDLHCQRLIKSAEFMGMNPPISAEEIEYLSREGVNMFPENTELYICPMCYPSGSLLYTSPSPRDVHLSRMPSSA